MLAVASALAAGLVRPLPGRAADDGGGARKASRTPQLHLPFGRRVADFARHLIGVPYAYGGTSPASGFDCSGLVRYVYAHFGIALPHSSYAQYDVGRLVSRRGLQPGDLLFFDDLGHVGLYLGNGRFIHAPHSGTRVRVETLAGWYGPRLDAARRIRSS